MQLHKDFDEFLQCLEKNSVEFIMVGAFALAYHGHPRSTGDMDLWVKPEEENAENLLRALSDFGFDSIDLGIDDILGNDIIQLGIQPVRIDIITKLSGVTNEELWESRIAGGLGDRKLNFIPLDLYIKNKKAIGRLKDLADIEALDKQE